MAPTTTKAVVFYYDIVCPYAYIASRRIERVAKTNGAEVICAWLARCLCPHALRGRG